MATRWKLVALVAAVVALIFGFLALDDDRGLETVGRDDESPPTSTIDEEPTGTDEGPPVSFVADAAPMDVEGVDLEPGTYRVDAVGTPFSLTLDQPMTPELNRAGMLELTHPDWAGPDDRDIRFVRLTALSDPTDPTKQLGDQQDGWPADDFAGWLENLTDGIQITNEEATTVGGLPAMRADLEVVDITCPSAVPITLCTSFGINDRGATAPRLCFLDRNTASGWSIRTTRRPSPSSPAPETRMNLSGWTKPSASCRRWRSATSARTRFW